MFLSLTDLSLLLYIERKMRLYLLNILPGLLTRLTERKVIIVQSVWSDDEIFSESVRAEEMMVVTVSLCHFLRTELSVVTT